MATYKSGEPLPPDHPLHPGAPAMIVSIRRLRPAAPNASADREPEGDSGARADGASSGSVQRLEADESQRDRRSSETERLP